MASAVYLHSKCHLTSPTWVMVHADGKHATVECAECRQPIAIIELGNEKKARKRALKEAAKILLDDYNRNKHDKDAVGVFKSAQRLDAFAEEVKDG